MLTAFLVGLVLSFVGSMPIAGPIAVIVVSKGLDDQPRAGLFVAIGAAIAESLYAGLAFLGLTAMLERYPLLLPVSRLFGCAILAALGVYFLARPSTSEKQAAASPTKSPRATALESAILGLSVTAVNPTLVVTWTAAVSAAHGARLLRVHELDAFPFAGGVATGIVSWFAVFLSLLGRFRKRLGGGAIDRAIRAMGIVLIVLGVGFGVRTVWLWIGAR